MTRILILLASLVLANSAHAEKWLCGTSSFHSSTAWCGTGREEFLSNGGRYKQYFFILEETAIEDGNSSRVTFREVDGEIAFDGTVCDKHKDDVGCASGSHFLGFDKQELTFSYVRHPKVWIKTGSFIGNWESSERRLSVWGKCASFDSQTPNSFFDEPKNMVRLVGFTPSVTEVYRRHIYSLDMGD